MHATAVRDISKVGEVHRNNFNSAIPQQVAEDLEDNATVHLPATAAAIATGGLFSTVARSLSTLGNRLFGALGANLYPIEDSDPDCSYSGPCGCC